jgi:hypothetical protein
MANGLMIAGGSGRARSSETILPTPGVTGTVKDADDNHCVFFHDEEYLIGETSYQRPADSPVDDGAMKRMARDKAQGRIDGGKEIRAQAGDPALAPFKGLREFRLRLWPGD